MENQKTGFIPLYRSVLKKPWAKDVFLRTLWENLLLGAARDPYTAFFKGRQWRLQPGQLVVTAADLGLQLCDRHGNPTSRDAVERMLSVFVREGMISIEGEKRKGRVITITNHSEYAQKMNHSPAHKAAHTSTHDEASNGAGLSVGAAHEGAHISAHHEQYILNTNVFNVRQRISKVVPDAAVQTPRGDKWGTSDDLRCAEWMLALRNITKPSLKKPNMAGWANDIRLMRELDGRTHKEICELFRWACKDSFWYKNILSPAKLRAKWDTLTLHREDTTRKPRADFSARKSETGPHWNSAEAWEKFI
ncbi:replication protein [Salmonella enterica subsp. enterica serovar Diguel]|nr:replication protein [Salmonella enterica subsp. enterica serovar Telelkebir]EBW9410435.1 replication protein [Salmonella enterica subsp. enterica serovar Telelkebir]ECK9219867.1 replication protein [Salmonella enterica subsp. enterica serovar Diguel]EEC6741832.1 replication protein [Salmonella enterica subsp. enterica serovar Telelkebir]EEN7393288.1 replication protein [Salmonella enterica subsp. enterica serovar Telelkebir]